MSDDLHATSSPEAVLPPRPFDLGRVGATVRMQYAVSWEKTVLYALAIGAGPDDAEYLYEAHGPRVFPTFAVIPSYPVVHALNESLAGDPLGVVQLAQHVRLHRRIPSQGILTTEGVLEGLFDHGAFASSQVATRTWDATGALICETSWTVGYMRDGGFGGPRPPRRHRVRPPTSSPSDFRMVLSISPRQAFLYRLTGDTNPLHVDPAFAARSNFERPILHGLCTYGFVGRAALMFAREAHVGELVEFGADFRGPVYPGDTLLVEGWRERSCIALRVSNGSGADNVLRNAYAEFRATP